MVIGNKTANLEEQVISIIERNSKNCCQLSTVKGILAKLLAIIISLVGEIAKIALTSL